MMDVKKFVTTRRGNVPIVLTAPHGGSPTFMDSPNMFLERTQSPQVVRKGDLKTMDLLYSIDSKVTSLTGGLKPYVVTLRVHRKFIDANRNILVDDQVAINKDCELSKQVYHHYHNSIEQMIEEASRSSMHGRVLLLDIHGMAPYADYIVCGTKHKVTCDRAFVERDHTGFLFHLRKLCGSTILPCRDSAADVSKYAGGYTVQRHGSGGVGGRCDAIQLEFGAFLRKEQQIDAAASVVASSLAHTLDPLRPFLFEVGRWNEHAVEKVLQKLRRIHCFTPHDLRMRMQHEKGHNSINASLRFIGERPFKKDTLEELAAKLGVAHPSDAGRACDDQTAAAPGAEIGLDAGQSSVSLVRRVFVPENHHVSLSFMAELLASPSVPTPSPTSVTDRGATATTYSSSSVTSEAGGTSSEDKPPASSTTATTDPAGDTVFTWDNSTGAAGKTSANNLILEPGSLRRLGGSGEELPLSKEDKEASWRSGTCVTLPTHDAFVAALGRLKERTRVVLESIDLGGGSTHVLAWVACRSDDM